MKKLHKLLIFLVFITAVCFSGFVTMKTKAADNQVRYDVKYGQTEARTMLKMINEFRTGDEAWYWQSNNTTKYVATGLKELVYDYDLEKIAMQRAAEIAAAFSHTRPDGTNCFTCTSNGVSSYGENIAAGTALNTAEKAFVLWQETNENYAGQGHRRNMLKDGYTAVGVGYAYVGGCYFWVQEFSYYKKTTSATDAIDTTQSVNVTIADEQITSKTLDASTDLVSMKEGESVDIPQVSLLLQLEETWPSYRKISSAVSVDWKVGDSTIIRITDGKIYGLKQGTTTLTAQANGMTVSVEVQVEHVAGNKVKENIIESKCATTGSYDMVVYCTKCGEELSRTTTTVPALGHTTAVDKSISATCETTGLTEGSHCSVCNEVLKAQEPVGALGHAYSEWKTVKKADCTEKGSQSKECSRCKDVQTRELEALGHADAIDEAKEPTCTETGLTEGSHCSVCNEVLKAQEPVGALGHAYSEWKTVKKADCTEKGSQSKECSRCKDVQTRELGVLGHVEAIDEAEKATCTETGLTEGKHCSRCNEVLVKQETVKATGHAYDTWIVETKATCEEEGSQYRNCKNCGNEEREVLEKLGHKFGDWETTTYPTCEAEGQECRVCDVCDKVENRTVEAEGHSFDEGNITKEATCTEDGLEETICRECGKTETESIEKLGHKFSTKWTIDKKATMSANGSKSKHCIRCNEKTSVTNIYKASNVKLGTVSYIYNGKMRSPNVVVKDSKGNVIGSANYTLSKPSGRKNVGKYTYKITFKNQYSGTKNLTLTINPKGTSISSLTKASKAFTVKWKKQSEKMATSRITGYQIQYAANKKFTNPKSKIVTGYNLTSKKITGLKAETTYYVRVRTYKTVKVNGKSVKLYSGWSTAKKVQIPK